MQYAMLRAGAEGTSTPLFVTFGIETCMLHGRLSPRPLEVGQLALIDLTPRVQGYCANLARTFILGQPDPQQRELLDTYAEIVDRVRVALRPGTTVGQLDELAGRVRTRHRLAEFGVYGLGTGLACASRSLPPRPSSRAPRLPLAEGMTVTIGHPVLAVPGFGGVRSRTSTASRRRAVPRSRRIRPARGGHLRHAQGHRGAATHTTWDGVRSTRTAVPCELARRSVS